MIRKSDWEAVQEEMLAEDRRALGEAPTAEELLAYSRGELSPADEERVRALLVAYPELARAVAVPFPADDDFSVSPREVSKRWRSFLEEIRPGAKVLQFWRASTALAAAMALVFGTLLWRAGSRSGPRVLADAQVLFPDGQRRAGAIRPVTVAATGETTVLIVPLFDAAGFARFRLELVDAQSDVLWRSEPQSRPGDDAFRLELPHGWLDAGTYRVVVYGVGDAREQPLGTYSLRVP